MNKLKEHIKIADIHVSRIIMAMDYLKTIFPLTPDKISQLVQQEILMLELFTSRFAKLQDLIGRKIIDEYLDFAGEFSEQISMNDKVNKLEKLEIVKAAELWQNMRQARNHIAHEYPDAPEITALYLNQLFDLAPELLSILSRIKAKLSLRQN